MSFRARMITAVTFITLVTLGVAFAVISVVVNRSQERHFDEALLEEVRAEAAELARKSEPDLALSARSGPTPNQVGPLAIAGALYARDGRVLAATPAFRGAPPPIADLRGPPDTCFDIRSGGVHLRAVTSAVPRHPGMLLLLAMPRADLDGDAVFLRRAMELVFAVAVAWTVLVATWIVRRLTRAQQRVARVMRQVAGGDLSARVGSTASGGDEVQLARDLDEMIDRLSDLLNAQRVFIAHAAHELRSPLTALYGELSLALRRPRDADAYRQVIGDALGSSRRLKDLAEDLLAVARLGAAPPASTAPVDVRLAVEHARRLAVADEASPPVRIEIEGACARVPASERDLVRLFRNLLENAVRHSPADGAVRVTLADAPGGAVVVSVSDQGPGIAETDRDRIFAPFYRGTSVPTLAGAEVGLGLTIARGIARAHGGDVVLQTRRGGEGACFQVTLPALVEAPAAESVAPVESAAPGAREAARM